LLPQLRGTLLRPSDYLLGSFRRQAVGDAKDRRSEKDFYKMPGGGLRDPQGEPPRKDTEREDDATTEPAKSCRPRASARRAPMKT
jgi:hypothetical protein